jgi:hypothetical protein
MIKKKGKTAGNRHIDDVSGSFLELSYLIHSLLAKGFSVAAPFRLRASSEPSALPLFTPISVQGMLPITNQYETDDTFNITFNGFSKEWVSTFPPIPSLLEQIRR